MNRPGVESAAKLRCGFFLDAPETELTADDGLDVLVEGTLHNPARPAPRVDRRVLAACELGVTPAGHSDNSRRRALLRVLELDSPELRAVVAVQLLATLLPQVPHAPRRLSHRVLLGQVEAD